MIFIAIREGNEKWFDKLICRAILEGHLEYQENRDIIEIHVKSADELSQLY